MEEEMAKAYACLSEIDVMIATLKQENEQLKARVAQLIEQGNRFIEAAEKASRQLSGETNADF